MRISGQLIAYSLLLTAYCSNNNSYAAPVYGTHMPEERHITAGIETDFVIDRNLDNDQGGTNGNRYFFTLSYGLFSWLSLDGKAGSGDVNWDRTGANDDLHYSISFSGAYGFRARLYENEDNGIKIVSGFQHISVHPGAKNHNSEKHEVIIDEWYGSVVVSKEIKSFVPYAGIRYGSLDYIKWINEHDRKRIKSEKMYGAVIGLDYRLDDRTKVNVECIFADGEEWAVGISRDF